MWQRTTGKANSPALALGLALAIAFLSGAAGLAHQMVWTRRLVDLLGASPLTFSKVVGTFFIGLAAGAALAARRSGPVRSPWFWVALAELCVALLALPVLLTPLMVDLLGRAPEWGPILKFVAPFLFVTPPALAMGLVMPWLIRALAAHNSATTSAVVWLYAVNTLGGVAGIVGVLFLALPALGLTIAGLVVCGVNLVVALMACALHLVSSYSVAMVPTRPEVQAHNHAVVTADALPKQTAGLAFFSGFFILALEVVLQHQFAQVTINSLFSSATVLVWVLISLTAGALLVPWLVRLIPNPGVLLRAVLFTAAVLCVAQPFVLSGLRLGLAILPYELAPGAYTWEVSKLGLLAISPLLAVTGLLFPLLLRQAVEGPPASASFRVGRLLVWNGLGGWLGSELAQSFITPSFGLWQSVILIGLGYALLAVWPGSVAQSAKRRPSLATTGLLLVGLVSLAGAFVATRSLPQATLREGEHLAALRVGREGVVATVECGPGDWRMLFNNSYTLGGSRAQSNQERQAHLPLLLHGHARDVALLGVATGSTVAGAAQHPGVERIDAAELSPLVLEQADRFFSPYNRNIFRDARVRFLPEDARWVMATHRATYDVIIGDLFLPWRTGEGRLFSVEHFEGVRRALKPDGLYCQWLPLFQLTRAQFESIARTFQQVFPDVLVVRGDFYTELPVLGLVGGRSLGQLNWTNVAAGCMALRTAGQVTDPLVRHVEGVAMMLVGPLPPFQPGPVNTLANAWLEWDAGKNILGLRQPWFVGTPAAEFVRDIQRSALPMMPEALRSAHEAGQFFLTTEMAAQLQLPFLPDLTSQIPQRLPPSLRSDPVARWLEWPSRIKPELEKRNERGNQ